jgi:hypothetical protein
MSGQATQPAKSTEPLAIVTEQSILSASEPQLPKPDSAFARFVRLHDRALVIIAIFVVIATFILKDIYRDDLRELRASISEAENMFRTREAFILMRKQLTDIQDRLANMPDQPVDGGLLEPSPGPPRPGQTSLPQEVKAISTQTSPATSPQATFMDAIVRLRDECGAVEDEMDNISDMAKVLSINSSDDVDILDYKDTTEKVKHSWSDILTDSKTSSTEKFKLVSSAMADVQNVEEELLAATPQLLDMAKIEEERKTHRYKIIEWASVICFLLGLGMGLLGRFYDIKGMAAG